MSTSAARAGAGLSALAALFTIATVAIDFGERRHWSLTDLVLYLVGVFGLAAALTVLWLSMRAVMDVGGFCAEGGPYEIEVHCPQGVGLLMPLAVFLGLGSAALAGIKGAALGGGWGSVVFLAWPALFISLGWNFLEYAFNPPGGEGGIVWGWLIPGVIFVLMGAVPLFGILAGSRALNGGRRRGAIERLAATAYNAAAEGEARYANDLSRQRRRLLSDLVQRAGQQSAQGGSGDAVTDSGDDLVSKLERLAALYRAGSLSYDEYQRAKDAVIDGGVG